MANLQRGKTLQRLAALRAVFAGASGAEVRHARVAGVENVALEVHSAQVKPVTVGASHQIRASDERLVDIDRRAGEAHRSERARMRSHDVEDFVGLGRPQCRCTRGQLEFGFVERVVAANDGYDWRCVGCIDQCLQLPLRRHVVWRGRQRVDRKHARRWELLRPLECAGLVMDWWYLCTCDLNVGGVIAPPTVDDFVFAGVGTRDEFDGVASAHRARKGLRWQGFQVTPRINPLIRCAHRFEGEVQSGLIDVEGIGIFHEKLAHPQQSAARPRLIAELRTDLVPTLRQLTVAVQIGFRDCSEEFFVRHREAVLAAAAVGESKHRFVDGIPAATRTPQIGRMQARQQEFLGSGGPHLVPEDALQPRQAPAAERQITVEASAKLTDEPGAHQ